MIPAVENYNKHNELYKHDLSQMNSTCVVSRIIFN